MKKEDIPKTHYWRWQFLRLNQDYRKAYDSFTERIQAAHSDQEKQSWIAEAGKDLFEDFGINGLFDYRIKNPPVELSIEGEDPPAQRGTLEHVFEGRLNEKQKICGPFFVERKDVYSDHYKKEIPVIAEKYVSVVINCDFSLEDVLADVRQIYNRTRIPRKRSLGVKRVNKLNKTNIQLLRKCLKIYELKENGKKWTVIGSKVYPHHSINSRTEKVRQNYYNMLYPFV